MSLSSQSIQFIIYIVLTVIFIILCTKGLYEKKILILNDVFIRKTYNKI
jgi:hypothetical protein